MTNKLGLSIAQVQIKMTAAANSLEKKAQLLAPLLEKLNDENNAPPINPKTLTHDFLHQVLFRKSLERFIWGMGDFQDSYEGLAELIRLPEDKFSRATSALDKPSLDYLVDFIQSIKALFMQMSTDVLDFCYQPSDEAERAYINAQGFNPTAPILSGNNIASLWSNYQQLMPLSLFLWSLNISHPKLWEHLGYPETACWGVLNVSESSDSAMLPGGGAYLVTANTVQHKGRDVLNDLSDDSQRTPTEADVELFMKHQELNIVFDYQQQSALLDWLRLNLKNYFGHFNIGLQAVNLHAEQERFCWYQLERKLASRQISRPSLRDETSMKTMALEEWHESLLRMLNTEKQRQDRIQTMLGLAKVLANENHEATQAVVALSQQAAANNTAHYQQRLDTLTTTPDNSASLNALKLALLNYLIDTSQSPSSDTALEQLSLSRLKAFFDTQITRWTERLLSCQRAVRELETKTDELFTILGLRENERQTREIAGAMARNRTMPGMLGAADMKLAIEQDRQTLSLLFKEKKRLEYKIAATNADKKRHCESDADDDDDIGNNNDNNAHSPHQNKRSTYK